VITSHGHVFAHGCNYPWSTDGVTVFYGLDFGANVWGSHLGVSTRRPAVERDFNEMARLGLNVVRWFVFCDGRAGIVYDDRDLPAGLDPHFFADLDAALEIAAAHAIALDLVLLDHPWMFRGVRATLADPVTGGALDVRLPRGRAHVLATESGRRALFTHVFEPLVRRYGRSGERKDLAPAVCAYELMNEPDFVIEEWEKDVSRQVTAPLPFEVMAGLVARLSGLVRAHSHAWTTLGCARVRNLWAWEDPALGLDLLQVHTYPDTKHPERDIDLYGLPPSRLGVSREVLIGEFPGDALRQSPRGSAPPARTLDEYLEFALERGYAGAWPWSFSGTDAYGRLPHEPLLQFARRHPHLANPHCRA
jgi:hypothetical protein